MKIPKFCEGCGRKLILTKSKDIHISSQLGFDRDTGSPRRFESFERKEVWVCPRQGTLSTLLYDLLVVFTADYLPRSPVHSHYHVTMDADGNVKSMSNREGEDAAHWNCFGNW